MVQTGSESPRHRKQKLSIGKMKMSSFFIGFVCTVYSSSVTALAFYLRGSVIEAGGKNIYMFYSIR